MGANLGLKIVTIAKPRATKTETQAQPGSWTRPAWVVSTWFQPKAPAAMSSTQSTPVLANVPPTVIVRVSAGAVGGAPIWVAAAAPVGDAQPGSSSSSVALMRLGARAGFAMGSTLAGRRVGSAAT